MPSEKRARQRAAREARLAAQAKAEKRRRQLRNTIAVVVVAGVIIGIVFLVSGNNSPSKPKSTTPKESPAQLAADRIAEKAGCPANTSTPANTQKYSAAPPMTIDVNKLYSADIDTTAGTFTVSLYAKAAPEIVNNFVFLADKGFYNCVIFHRVIPGFMDQTGDPTGTGSGGPGYTLTSQNTPPSYATGQLAMASSASGVNGSQFFVLATGGASQLGSGNYPLFGSVITGMNVVDKINSEGNSTASANGTPPKVTERILSIKIHEASGP